MPPARDDVMQQDTGILVGSLTVKIRNIDVEHTDCDGFGGLRRSTSASKKYNGRFCEKIRARMRESEADYHDDGVKLKIS